MDDLQNLLSDCHISKDWKLVRAIGGKKLVHARGCVHIADCNMDGFNEIPLFKSKKMRPCPTCGKMVFITLGAKDYVDNLPRYQKFFEDVLIENVITFFRNSRAKTKWFGDKMFVHCRKDDWYIDLSLDECKLFHNNYKVGHRETNQMFDAKGFHEHPLQKQGQTERLNEALRHISGYRYEEAERVHERKRKPRMTFSEYDAEYWGFNANKKSICL